MDKLSIYKVKLKGMCQDSSRYEWMLTDRFFADVEAPDIQKGNLNVILQVKKSIGTYVLDFHIEGTVVVTCDRCLDDLELPVETDNTLNVKLGDEFSEENDLVTVPEEEGYINVAWFIYEFVALSLPMKKVHAPGECNELMTEVLRKHNCVSFTEDDDTDWVDEESTEVIPDKAERSDSRWDELKKILNNN